jgi:hypothetical protein
MVSVNLLDEHDHYVALWVFFVSEGKAGDPLPHAKDATPVAVATSSDPVKAFNRFVDYWDREHSVTIDKDYTVIMTAKVHDLDQVISKAAFVGNPIIDKWLDRRDARRAGRRS